MGRSMYNFSLGMFSALVRGDSINQKCLMDVFTHEGQVSIIRPQK